MWSDQFFVIERKSDGQLFSRKKHCTFWSEHLGAATRFRDEAHAKRSLSQLCPSWEEKQAAFKNRIWCARRHEQTDVTIEERKAWREQTFRIVEVAIEAHETSSPEGARMRTRREFVRRRWKASSPRKPSKGGW